MLFKKSQKAIEIKGFGQEINIIIDDEAIFSDIEKELTKKLKETEKLLSGTSVVLDIGNRILSPLECKKIKSILKDKFNLEVLYVRTLSTETQESVRKIGWKTEFQYKLDNQPKEKEEEKMYTETNISQNNRENDTIIVTHTLRSGQKEYHDGNIVLIGDVNPGAEIEATGDIVIFGKLRGMAHAGVEGNTSARIIAMELNPIQLRIAGIIGRAPDRGSDPNLKSDGIPEIARIEGENIVIQKLK